MGGIISLLAAVGILGILYATVFKNDIAPIEIPVIQSIPQATVTGASPAKSPVGTINSIQAVVKHADTVVQEQNRLTQEALKEQQELLRK